MPRALKQRDDTPVEAGNRFKVERDGGMGWFLATILERRPLKKVLKSKGADVDLAELNGTDFEYYVNYDGMDSRCEWVVLDRIDTRIPFPLLKIKSRGRGRAWTSSVSMRICWTWFLPKEWWGTHVQQQG